MDNLRDLLDRMEAGTVDAVTLLKAGVGFDLGTGQLTCIRLPRVLRGGAELPQRSAEWFQALWDAVGETPRDASLADGRLAFTLGGCRIEVDLDAPDHDDPESAILSFKDAGWAVL